MSLTIPQVRLPEIPCHRSVVLAQQMVQNVHASARHDVPIALLFWQARRQRTDLFGDDGARCAGR